MSVEVASQGPTNIILAEPRGFCAGVKRSIEAYRETLDSNPGKKIYSVGEPAHNNRVNRRFRDRGVIFVNEVSDVPEGSITLLGPHGSTPEDLEIAQERKLKVVDTICPLVEKVHNEVRRFLKDGFTITYYGKRGHPEARGVLGLNKDGAKIILVESLEELEMIEVLDPEKVAFNSQTTHAANRAKEVQERAREKWPNLQVPNRLDVCYATQNRQNGVKAIIERGAGVVVIVGSSHSSNSQELKRVAREAGARVFFVDNVMELKEENFYGFSCVGVSSGASVDEIDVKEVIEFFKRNGAVEIETVTVADESRIRFSRPKMQSF